MLPPLLCLWAIQLDAEHAFELSRQRAQSVERSSSPPRTWSVACSGVRLRPGRVAGHMFFAALAPDENETSQSQQKLGPRALGARSAHGTGHLFGRSRGGGHIGDGPGRDARAPPAGGWELRRIYESTDAAGSRMRVTAYTASSSSSSLSSSLT